MRTQLQLLNIIIIITVVDINQFYHTAGKNAPCVLGYHGLQDVRRIHRVVCYFCWCGTFWEVSLRKLSESQLSSWYWL